MRFAYRSRDSEICRKNQTAGVHARARAIYKVLQVSVRLIPQCMQKECK